MNSEQIPDEVKIIHIHEGNDDKSSFIEFITLRNGKTFLLKYDSFVKRFSKELIEEFKSSKVK